MGTVQTCRYRQLREGNACNADSPWKQRSLRLNWSNQLMASRDDGRPLLPTQYKMILPFKVFSVGGIFIDKTSVPLSGHHRHSHHY